MQKKPQLWVFGDSFAMERNYHTNFKIGYEWWWGNQLRDLLGCRSVRSNAQLGVANEFTQYTIKKCLPQMQRDDFVVIVSTDKARRWFFKDREFVGNYWVRTIKEHTTREQHNALKQYATHLTENDELSNMYLEAFLAWCHFISNIWQFRLCILPGFEWSELHNTQQGNLFKIDCAEFATWDLREQYFANHDHKDARVGHLSEPNHTVLAHSIAEFMADHYQAHAQDHRINLDPNSGKWHTNLYTADSPEIEWLDAQAQHERARWPAEHYAVVPKQPSQQDLAQLINRNPTASE